MADAGQTATFTIHEAKTNLSKLIALALDGGDVVIARGKEPKVRLVPVTAAPPDDGKPKPKREPGTLKGLVWLDDRFFDPLPEDELRRWEGEKD